MKVKLIAYMQWNPEILYGLDFHTTYLNDPEWIAAVAMRSTRTNESLTDLILENTTEKARKRIVDSVKWGHFTVVGMTDFIFLIEGISRACSHQLVRHRTAWFLQQSQRAVDPTEEEFIVPDSIRKKIFWGPEIRYHLERIKDFYRAMVENGIPKEDARFILPNATPTRLIMKIDGSNLLHFFKLRLDEHAQWEIRKLAELMHEEVMKVCPNLFDLELREHWW